jgi:hypothetical protein
VFQQLIKRLHSHALDFRSHLKGVLANSTAIASDFYDLLNDVPKPHPFMTVIPALKKNHEHLNTEGSEGEIFQHFNEVFIKVLIEEKESCEILEKRIALRNSLRKDYLYYKKKYEKLQIENDKLKANPQKDIPIKDVERLERNSQKLKEIEDNYIKTNRAALDDLNLKWKARLHKYGPLLNEFLNIERIFVTKYAKAIESLISNEKIASFQHSKSEQSLDPAIIRVSKMQAEDERRGNVTPVDVSLRRASRSDNSQLGRGRAYSENRADPVPNGDHLAVQNSYPSSRRATPPVPIFPAATTAALSPPPITPVIVNTPVYNPEPYVSPSNDETTPGEGAGETDYAYEGSHHGATAFPDLSPPQYGHVIQPQQSYASSASYTAASTPAAFQATPQPSSNQFSIASAPSPSYNQTKVSNPFDDD